MRGQAVSLVDSLKGAELDGLDWDGSVNGIFERMSKMVSNSMCC